MSNNINNEIEKFVECVVGKIPISVEHTLLGEIVLSGNIEGLLKDDFSNLNRVYKPSSSCGDIVNDNEVKKQRTQLVKEGIDPYKLLCSSSLNVNGEIDVDSYCIFNRLFVYKDGVGYYIDSESGGEAVFVTCDVFPDYNCISDEFGYAEVDEDENDDPTGAERCINSSVFAELKQGTLGRSCGISDEYRAYVPILQELNGRSCLLIPYMKRPKSGEGSADDIYPIRYALTVDLAINAMVRFEDLSVVSCFDKVCFNRSLVTGGCPKCADATTVEWDDTFNYLLELYKAKANTGGSDWDEDISKIVKELIDRRLYGMYEYLDKDFVQKYLKSDNGCGE